MTIRLRKGVSVADIDYGVALLDEDTGQYWNLNPTGAVVLRTLLTGGTAAQAAHKITGEYAVDIDTADKDVQELVGDLQSAGLLEGQLER